MHLFLDGYSRNAKTPFQTAATITFVIYMLAQHPDVLLRLREEILTEVGSSRRPTYDDRIARDDSQHSVQIVTMYIVIAQLFYCGRFGDRVVESWYLIRRSNSLCT
jgi:hypothetical protein